MSVATKNPFSILDDEESPEAAPKVEETPAPSPAPSRGNAKKGGGPASRGGKYYSRGGKPLTPKDKESPAEEPAFDNQRKFDGPREGNREGSRGDGRGRGRGRGGPGRGRGRPFDRHSQTDKTDSDKKIHQSWGGDDGNTEFRTEQAASLDAVAESSKEWGAAPAANEWSAPAATEWGADTITSEWGAPAEASVDAWAAPDATDAATPAEGEAKPEGGRGRKEKEAEEEDNTLTLEQYLTKQKEKESAVPKLEDIRKANDGAEDVWKDAVVLTKNEDEEAYYVGKVKNAVPKSRAKKEEKTYIEIDGRFERPERPGGRGRGRGDRGDRGFGDRGFGDRGERGERGRGRGRGGGRGGRQSNGAAAALNVDDQTAFPSLSRDVEI